MSRFKTLTSLTLVTSRLHQGDSRGAHFARTALQCLFLIAAVAMASSISHAGHPLAILSAESPEACSVADASLGFATEPTLQAVWLTTSTVSEYPESLGYLPVPATKIAAEAPVKSEGTNWGATVNQSARFLFIQHSVRIGLQSKTRRNLRGPYFRDYVNSVRGFSGWDDGDSFLTNYIGHPMQGSISGSGK